MRLRLSLGASLLVVTPGLLAAQATSPTDDSALVLVVEHRFAGSSDQVLVSLERNVVYRLIVSGPGVPVFHAAHGGGQSAFVVPVGRDTSALVRRFEAYPYQTGEHAILLSDLPAGATTTLRLYRDVNETRRTRPLEPVIAVGVQLGAGAHSGYRLDSAGVVSPKAGTDWEASILAVAGDRITLCVGFSEQSLPDAGFSVHWTFIQGSGRVVSAYLAGRHRTDLAVAVRYSGAKEVGPQQFSPHLTSFGLYLTQHLSEGSRGWSGYASWLLSRLSQSGRATLTTNRVMAGVTWVL